MAVKKQTRRPRPGQSFDVTRVLGTVHLDPSGEESASLAAFKLIDQMLIDGYNGEYVFQVPGAPSVKVIIGDGDARG